MMPGKSKKGSALVGQVVLLNLPDASDWHSVAVDGCKILS